MSEFLECRAEPLKDPVVRPLKSRVGTEEGVGVTWSAKGDPPSRQCTVGCLARGQTACASHVGGR